TEAGLSVTVFGALPGVLAELRSNRAVDVPLFVIHRVACWEKSWLSSVKPRFRLTAPGSKYAITFVSVAGIGWTTPVPPRRTRYPLTKSELPVFRIAAFTSATVQEGC